MWRDAQASHIHRLKPELSDKRSKAIIDRQTKTVEVFEYASRGVTAFLGEVVCYREKNDKYLLPSPFAAHFDHYFSIVDSSHHPQRPLNILTLDGYGVQAISQRDNRKAKWNSQAKAVRHLRYYCWYRRWWLAHHAVKALSDPSRSMPFIKCTSTPNPNAKC